MSEIESRAWLCCAKVGCNATDPPGEKPRGSLLRKYAPALFDIAAEALLSRGTNMSTEPDFLNHYEPTCEQLEALAKAICEVGVGNPDADDLFYSHDSNALPALREIIRSAAQLPVPCKPARV